jgi:protein-tyrosine phosphatase
MASIELHFADSTSDTIDTFTDKRLAYLSISNQWAAQDATELKKHGITHVFSVTSECSSMREQMEAGSTKRLYNTLGIQHQHYACEDQPSAATRMMEVAEAICKRMDELRRLPNTHILVHCRAGISRSATVLLYHLMHSWGMSDEEALLCLKQTRPVVQPNDGFALALQFAFASRAP